MDRNYDKGRESNNENRGRKIVKKNHGNNASDSSRSYNPDRSARFGSNDNRRGEGRFDRNNADRSGGERREYRSDRPSSGNSYNRDRKPYTPEGGYRREGNFRPDSRPAREVDGNRFNREGNDRCFGNEGGERRFSRDGGEKRFDREGGERHFSRDNNDRRPTGSDRRFSREGGEGRFNRDNERPRFGEQNRNDRSERPTFRRREDNDRPVYQKRDNNDRPTFQRRDDNDRPTYTDRRERSSRFEEISESEKQDLRQKHYSKKKQLEHQIKNVGDVTELRLNRYISMAGVCSRRDADTLIQSGRVKVNDVVVTVVGTKVKRKDKVEIDEDVIIPEKKVYLVLNKPKDFVTTVEDPLERKTVMSLVEGACKERIYPVGRLDRMTTGVLLFTNDGDMAKKLTHPKFNQKKIYHVFVDKVVSQNDMEAILKGIELEDGFVQADDISYVSEDRMEVGIEIHSGKNRIVRRIFEHFGYQITKLDRVYFAGITKKNIPRSKWRFLTTEEIDMLKYY